MFNTVIGAIKLHFEGGEKQMTVQNKKLLRGFTLIELLIVMAILGVLAVVVLVAINPVQQLARTRDAGRKSGVTQIGHALEAYYTARGGNYVDEGTVGNNWIDELVAAGELSSAPSAIQYTVTGSAACTLTNGAVQNNFCYKSQGNDGSEPAIIYVTMESDSETSKCAAGSTAYFVWSTADGRGGLICLASGEPMPGAQIWNSIQ